MLRLVTCAFIVGVFAGCGTTAGSKGAASTPPTTPLVDRSELVIPPPGPSPAKPVSRSGTVEEGVEAGCLILRTTEGEVLTLVGAVAGARVGALVTVRGRVDPERVSTCQQGQVFVVTEMTDRS